MSILGVVAGGLFCLIQWLRRRFRRRRERSFEAYILQVARVERRALALSRAPTLDLAALLQLQEDLTQIKGEALERFADGELDGEELMSGFLVHASDTRDFLIRLILHERDNLEDHARAQRRPAEVLWNEAVGELPHSGADPQVPEQPGHGSLRRSRSATRAIGTDTWRMKAFAPQALATTQRPRASRRYPPFLGPVLMDRWPLGPRRVDGPSTRMGLQSSLATTSPVESASGASGL